MMQAKRYRYSTSKLREPPKLPVSSFICCFDQEAILKSSYIASCFDMHSVRSASGVSQVATSTSTDISTIGYVAYRLYW